MFGKKSSAKKTSSAAKSTTKKPDAKKPASKTTKSVSKTQTQDLAEYIRQKPANLIGAGLGMKGENTRNFEAGVLSSHKDFVKNAAEQFDSVWLGVHCKGCRRKESCGDPIRC